LLPKFYVKLFYFFRSEDNSHKRSSPIFSVNIVLLRLIKHWKPYGQSLQDFV
jgi:hypothetical protein